MTLLLDILSRWNVPGPSTDAHGAGLPGGPLEGRDQGEITPLTPGSVTWALTSQPPHLDAAYTAGQNPHASQAVGNERSVFVLFFFYRNH